MTMHLKSVGMLLLAAGLLVGCAAPTPTTATPLPATTPVATQPADPATPTPASATDTPEPGIGAGEVPPTLPDTGMAVVENVDVRILESFPVQVQAVVTGYLPDSCTTITSVAAVNEGAAFRIHFTTDRPADAMCAMVITNFEEVVPLDTTGLPAGSYQVVVNNLAVNFELPGGAEAQPQPEAGAYPVVETETAFVLAQVDVPMYDAPLAGGVEIGMIAGGMIARVTGASPDGAWWRVICPDDTVGDCWVSAAPEMTAPAAP